jgi:hypothetical protein
MITMLLSSIKLGEPNITGITFYSTTNNQSLTCTSVGGPATSITWMKNGVPLVSKHARLQQVADFVAAIYLNILSLDKEHPDSISGSYTCLVNNSRGGDKMNFELQGIYV